MTILWMRNELGVEVPLKSDELDINIETKGCVTPGVGKKNDAHFDQSFYFLVLDSLLNRSPKGLS